MGEGHAGPLFEPRGCERCGQAGYLGRQALYEAVPVDEALRRAIGREADESALAELAFAGRGDLRAAARDAVAAGTTSVEEALRVIRQDEKAEGPGHAGV